jgi:hypothetical protein
MRELFAAGGTGVKADAIAAVQLPQAALQGHTEAARCERDIRADEGSLVTV